MHKILIGLLAATCASAASAAVEIDFNTATGNLGPSHTYSNGGLSVTAYGYSYSFSPIALYGKNASAADEKGVGIANDPSGDHEIWDGIETGGFVFLDVSNLLANDVTEAQFRMGSTTDGEEWTIYGYNGGFFSLLTGGDELTWHDLPGWGSYSAYAFTATNPGDNVLLGALSVTQGVPEPATWAMMLVGFGAMGVAFRRRRRVTVTLPQLA
jgi:hypothetical protein